MSRRGSSDEAAEGRGLFTSPDFARLFAGAWITQAAGKLLVVTVFLTCGLVCASPGFDLALTTAFLLPLLVFAPVFGVRLDRGDPGAWLINTTALRALAAILLLALLMFLGLPRYAALLDLIPAPAALSSLLAAPAVAALLLHLPGALPKGGDGRGAGAVRAADLAAWVFALTIGRQVVLHLGEWLDLSPGSPRSSVLTLLLSAFLFLIAILFFRKLPEPDEKREIEARKKEGWFRAFAGGISCALTTRGAAGLLAFECLFWMGAALFLFLAQGAATAALGTESQALDWFYFYVFGLVGLAVAAGALVSGRLSRSFTPILSYPAGLFLAGMGMALFFGAKFQAPAEGQGWNPAIADWFLRLAPGAVCFGLGSGLVGGRVDADLLAIVPESHRGRVLAWKTSCAAAGALLAAWLLLPRVGWDVRSAAAEVFPRYWMWMAAPAVVLAWLVDVALFAGLKEAPPHGLKDRIIQTLGWYAGRAFGAFYWRFSVRGREQVPMEGPVILVANHGSFLDPWLLGFAAPRRVQYIMHASYYRSLAHPFFRFWNAIPLEEGGPLAALRAGLRSLERGACLGMFPEGHVSEHGGLQPPQPGVLVLAQRSGAPVIPVALKGNVRVMPRRAWLPRPYRLTVIFGRPLRVPREANRRQLEELAGRLMQELAQMLEVAPPAGSAPPEKCDRKAMDAVEQHGE
jgi:1-acyl-sn-glycerol-3-phosphate acyltransferase